MLAGLASKNKGFSFLSVLCQTNFILRKFHTVKNGYQYVYHIFRTNISHFVKIRTKSNFIITLKFDFVRIFHKVLYSIHAYFSH